MRSTRRSAALLALVVLTGSVSELPRTGATIWYLALLGVALLGFGGLAVATSRRRTAALA